MRVGGAGKRRDLAEGPIVDTLRAVGAEVWRLHDRGVGDLLVRFRGVLHCAEVKTGKGTLEPTQGKFPIWRTPDEALKAIGATV